MAVKYDDNEKRLEKPFIPKLGLTAFQFEGNPSFKNICHFL